MLISAARFGEGRREHLGDSAPATARSFSRLHKGPAQELVCRKLPSLTPPRRRLARWPCLCPPSQEPTSVSSLRSVFPSFPVFLSSRVSLASGSRVTNVALLMLDSSRFLPPHDASNMGVYDGESTSRRGKGRDELTPLLHLLDLLQTPWDLLYLEACSRRCCWASLRVRSGVSICCSTTSSPKLD